jgi:hypothetical protein
MKVNFKFIVYATILAVTSYCLGALTTSIIAEPNPIEHNDGRFKERSQSREDDEIRNTGKIRLTDSLRTHLGVVQEGKNTYAIYYLVTYKYNDVDKDGKQSLWGGVEATIPQYIYQRELVK